MADKRMFSKKITNSDEFLDMPKSAQALYFHLCLESDDDGFMDSPKRILRAVACTEDDLKILIAKGFVIYFASGVIAIRDWKINNYIRCDRYTPTKHLAEREMLEVDKTGAYRWKESALPTVDEYEELPDVDTVGIPLVYHRDTQIRIDKNRIDKDRLEQDSIDKGRGVADNVVSMYNTICISLPRVTKISDARKKAINARLNAGYTIEDFEELFQKAEDSNFLKGSNNRNWTADFDWLIKDANMAKTLDGKYDGSNHQPRAVATADRVANMMRNGEFDD